MNVIELVRCSVMNYASIKIVLSILGLAVSIPLISLWYWSFDSSYLAAFGIGPEIFSRPVFSSKLMLTRFIFEALAPSLLALGIIAIVLFIVLLGINYRTSKSKVAHRDNVVDESDSTAGYMSVINIIDRSITPVAYLFLTPLIIFILLLSGMGFMSEKADKLALGQITDYYERNICPDAFSNRHRGCYSISGEPGNNYFVIANNERIIIYLSKENKNNESVVFVTIKDKLSNKKIIREYKRIIVNH